MDINFIKALGLQHGFELCGAIHLEDLTGSTTNTEDSPYSLNSEHAALFNKRIHYFSQWLENKNHGEMNYLERGLEKRKNLRLLFDDVKTIVVFGLPYNPNAPQEYQQPNFKISSYITQTFDNTGVTSYKDYHDVIISKLKNILSTAQQTNPELKGKVCVDTSALLEKALAEVCGLGWYGKNTLILNPKFGSYFFIGVLLFNQEIDSSMYSLPKILSNYCGNCSACISQCPTQAIQRPGILDARQCISYLTLEHRSELALPLHGWVAGCDICQQVCPFNKKIISKNETMPIDPSWPKQKEDWVNEQDIDYKKRVKQTALSRIKPQMMKRNLKNTNPF